MNNLKKPFFIKLLIFGVTISCHAEIVIPFHGSAKNPRIRTIEWQQNGNHQNFPVINLNQGNSLTLSFDIIGNDDMDSTFSWLQCNVEHRNADWEKEYITDEEIINGFNVFDIGYGELSLPGTTTIPYRHYNFTVSANDLGLKISGNYVLNVFSDNNTDSIFFSIPFMVEEQTVNINGTVSPVTDVDYKKGHQQLSITVDNSRLDKRVKAQDMILEIGRNNELNYFRRLDHPSQIANNKIFYEHQKELIFDAGNEYRRIETTNMNYPGLNIQQIEWKDPFYHHFVNIDELRGDMNYIYDETQFGGYTINESNSTQPDLESDYSIVHFFLDIPEEMKDDIYILGDGTGTVMSEENKMMWDAQNEVYTKAFLLKQAAYDYKYFTENQSLLNLIEGNFSDTRNQYRVLLYYRIPGERYDRLAGTALIRSYTAN